MNRNQRNSLKGDLNLLDKIVNCKKNFNQSSPTSETINKLIDECIEQHLLTIKKKMVGDVSSPQVSDSPRRNDSRMDNLLEKYRLEAERLKSSYTIGQSTIVIDRDDESKLPSSISKLLEARLQEKSSSSDVRKWINEIKKLENDKDFIQHYREKGEVFQRHQELIDIVCSKICDMVNFDNNSSSLQLLTCMRLLVPFKGRATGDVSERINNCYDNLIELLRKRQDILEYIEPCQDLQQYIDNISFAEDIAKEMREAYLAGDFDMNLDDGSPDPSAVVRYIKNNYHRMIEKRPDLIQILKRTSADDPNVLELIKELEEMSETNS